MPGAKSGTPSAAWLDAANARVVAVDCPEASRRMAGVDDAEKVDALVEDAFDKHIQLIIDERVFDAGAGPSADVVGQEYLVGATLLVAIEIGLLRAVAGKVEHDQVTEPCSSRPALRAHPGSPSCRPGQDWRPRPPARSPDRRER